MGQGVRHIVVQFDPEGDSNKGKGTGVDNESVWRAGFRAKNGEDQLQFNFKTLSKSGQEKGWSVRLWARQQTYIQCRGEHTQKKKN